MERSGPPQTDVPAAGRWSTLKGNVLMLGIVSFFTDLSSEMIYPLLPVFFTGLVPLATAAIYVGLMEGLAESAASLLKLVTGRLSDVLGRRKVFVVAGYGISTIARPLMALATAGWHVIALRFLDRVGKGTRTAARDALIGDSADATARGLAFSFHRAMDHAGAVAGPLTAIALLYGFLGYGLWQSTETRATPDEMRALRMLFAIALVPGIAAMIALAWKVREVAPTRAARTHPGEDPHVPLPSRFYWFVATVTLFTLGNSSDLFLVFYGKTKFQLGLVQIIGLWVALHLSKIAFSLPGGMLSDRLGRKPVLVMGWSVYALVYLGMALVKQSWLFLALILAYGIYYGFTEGVEKALVADLVPTERRGTAYGIYHGAVGLATLPASLVFGVFWAALGPSIAFGIGAGLAGLATAMLVALLSKPGAG